jgi:hypothetical protein
VYFITGTAYAGKSTAVKLLSERCDMIFCGENYHTTPDSFPRELLSPAKQPALCYFDTMSGWQEFINRTPEAYWKWIRDGCEEAAEIEIAELIKRASSGKKVIVDTNIPLPILREISEYNRVAVMLSPPSMSAEHFFNRDDEDKKFIFQQIQQAENPEKTMANYKECIKLINMRGLEAHSDSGFFTLMRERFDVDTLDETIEKLAAHFGLQ